MKTTETLLKELLNRFEFMLELSAALTSPETPETEKTQIIEEMKVLSKLQVKTEAELKAVIVKKKPSLFKRIFKK